MHLSWELFRKANRKPEWLWITSVHFLNTVNNFHSLRTQMVLQRWSFFIVRFWVALLVMLVALAMQYCNMRERPRCFKLRDVLLSHFLFASLLYPLDILVVWASTARTISSKVISYCRREKLTSLACQKNFTIRGFKDVTSFLLQELL